MLRRGASQLQQHLSRAGQCARTAAGTAATLQGEAASSCIARKRACAVGAWPTLSRVAAGLELDTATPTTSSPSCHESTARLVFSAHEQQQQQQQGWACQWQAAAGPRSHGPSTHHARQPPWALSASCLHTATVPQGYVQVGRAGTQLGDGRFRRIVCSCQQGMRQRHAGSIRLCHCLLGCCSWDSLHGTKRFNTHQRTHQSPLVHTKQSHTQIADAASHPPCGTRAGPRWRTQTTLTPLPL